MKYAFHAEHRIQASIATKRIDWLDAVRGIGIILVVFGHTERGLVGAGIARGPSWSWIDYSLYTFHMPLFFLLAGINLPKSLAKGTGHFLRAKLWTIAYPYFLWSVIQGAILAALSRYANHGEPLSSLLTIGWQPQSQFWFLYALMACQLMGLVLAPWPRIMSVVAAVGLIASNYLQHGSLPELVLHAFAFFAFGALCSDRIFAWSQNSRWRWVGSAAIGLAIWDFVSGRIDQLNFDATVAILAAGCGIASVIMTARLLEGGLFRWACVLGRASMTIYVLHILAGSGMRIAMAKLHAPAAPWLYAGICTAVGVIVPLQCHVWLERFDLLTPLGLAPLRRRARLPREQVEKV